MQNIVSRRGIRIQRIVFPSLASLVPYVLWPLLVAGLSELILFRTLSRVAVHIPKQGIALAIFDALVHVGSYAFNLASVAVVVALVLVSCAAMRGQFGRRPLAAAVGPGLIALAGGSVLLGFLNEDSTARLLYGLISAAIMLALAGQALGDRQRAPWRSVIVGVTVLAYLFAQYHVLAIEAYQSLAISSNPPASIAALEIAEALVLLNAFLVFCVWSGVRLRPGAGPTRLQLVTAGVLIVLFLGSYYGRPDSSTASILSLWSLGLTLYLPVPLYALALGLYGATIVRCFQRARREETAALDTIALAILPVAGLTLELTYQYLVALLALLLLTLANNAVPSQREGLVVERLEEEAGRGARI